MWAVIESPWTLEVTIGNQERISQKNFLLLVIVFALISEGVCRSSLFWKNKATICNFAETVCVDSFMGACVGRGSVGDSIKNYVYRWSEATTALSNCGKILK